MGLSPELVEEHIALWEMRLQGVVYPHRQKWPSRLFHHTPLENAVRILKDGNLRSRHDSEDRRLRDVAANEVLANRTHAHGLVRIYFRPRTPTQYHIEGIMKAGEAKFGDNTHAPVLFMLVLHARRVLTRAGVSFCDRNMQLGNATPGDDETYFKSIPFDKVYHEGPIYGDRSIIDHRCAEVLTPSPLPLNEVLQWIYCRSEAEKETLLNLLGADANFWERFLLVSVDLKVFERRFVFVEWVKLSDVGVAFRLNPRPDRQKIHVRLRVIDCSGAALVDVVRPEIAATPDYPATSWRYPCSLPNGKYRVQMELEGHLAFDGICQLGPTLV